MRVAFVFAVLFVSTVAHGEEETPRPHTPWRELAVSVGVSTVMAPAVYSTASLVGRSTANLNTSALPALLIGAFVPPLIATGALAWERHREGAQSKFLVPYVFSTVAQVVVLFASTYAKTWVGNSKDLLLLSAATGVATGSASTLGAEISF